MLIDSVKEIRVKQAELEKRIMRDLQQFEKETGVWVSTLNFGRNKDVPSLTINNLWVGVKL